MKKNRYLLFSIMLLALCACGNKTDGTISDNEIPKDASASAENVSAENAAIDEAMAMAMTASSVSDNSADGASDANADDSKEIIYVQRIDGGGLASASPSSTNNADGNSVVSSAPSTYTLDNSDENDDDGETTGFGTPVSFAVDACMISADGTYDTTFSSAILTALNNARINAGLDTFDVNTSLGKVADVRAKELTYSLGHLRADGSYWSTVAPEYYEAECIAKNFSNATDTVNAWLSDIGTSQYLLSDDLYSIGVSCFKYGDDYYIVASLGS